MPGIDVGALFISFLVLLFSLTIHEAAHALTADRLGDPTARLLGRISLNPLVHVDPIGTILLPLVAFASGAPIIGWAKPVPVDISRLRRERRDFVLVAAAGPASNILLALLASVALRVIPPQPFTLGEMNVAAPLLSLAAWALQLNLLLAVFNMIPIPPLDGGNVLSGLLPDGLARIVDGLRPYGFLLLYALLLTGALRYILGPPYGLLSRLLIP